MAKRKNDESAVSWSEEDEKYFLQRYALSSQNDRLEYLTGQAFLLFLNNIKRDESIYDAVLRLLKKYSEDFPDDKTKLHTVLLIKAKIYYARKDYDTALRLYGDAATAETESQEETDGAACLCYAETVLKLNKTELFDAAEKCMASQYEKYGYTIDGYNANRILSVLAEKKNDKEKQGYYQDRADLILNDASQFDKRVRYVKVIKSDDTITDELKDDVRAFIVSKGFTLCVNNGELLWQRKRVLGLHNLAVYQLFDAIIIVAFVSFRDPMLGYETEMGLGGFLVGFLKWPLKSAVKKLEKLIEQNLGTKGLKKIK